VIRVLTAGEEKTVRQIAAELVRAWADRRLIIFKHGRPYAQRERLVVTPEDRRLLEACADDIEWGRR